VKKYKTNYYVLFLTLLFLLVNIFSEKIINIVPSLNVSISLIIYPITFLLVIIIYKKYNKKEAKESILSSALLVLLFYIIVSLLCSFTSVIESNEINNNLRNVFTPNYFHIYNLNIYYPNLLNLFVTMVVYLFTHYICLTLYEIIEENSNYFIAFMFALLISLILDQIILVPIINIPNMYYNDLDFVGLIKILTGDFFMVIVTTIILIFLYPLCLNKKERIIN
jgi:uncharacterized PurR-regulated membrane protein YhhQ (DUF165 family)